VHSHIVEIGRNGRQVSAIFESRGLAEVLLLLLSDQRVTFNDGLIQSTHVHDVVLGATVISISTDTPMRTILWYSRNDTSALNALDRLSNGNTSQDRIGREAFPVTTTFRVLANPISICVETLSQKYCPYTADWSHDRSKLDINSLHLVLGAHVDTLLAHNGAVPCRGHSDTGWESRSKVREPNTQWRILQA
jgi:hypothetical protein